MDKVIEAVDEWFFRRTLPTEIAGFTLANDLVRCGTQYRLFSYHHPDRRRSLSVLYDKATKDFLTRVTVGLTEYYDVDFIVNNIETLECTLTVRMEKTLGVLATFNRETLSRIFLDKKILDWRYGAELPEEIAGFERFIRPQEPVKVLNGSYIIIDYSDFAAESGLLIYYNIYRDEFFGEKRIRCTPQPIGVFDAKDLSEFEEKLSEHLEPTLENIRAQLI